MYKKTHDFILSISKEHRPVIHTIKAQEDVPHVRTSLV